jgi:hypothetical protein
VGEEFARAPAETVNRSTKLGRVPELVADLEQARSSDTIPKQLESCRRLLPSGEPLPKISSP